MVGGIGNGMAGRIANVNVNNNVQGAIPTLLKLSQENALKEMKTDSKGNLAVKSRVDCGLVNGVVRKTAGSTNVPKASPRGSPRDPISNYAPKASPRQTAAAYLASIKPAASIMLAPNRRSAALPNASSLALARHKDPESAFSKMGGRGLIWAHALLKVPQNQAAYDVLAPKFANGVQAQR